MVNSNRLALFLACLLPCVLSFVPSPSVNTLRAVESPLFSRQTRVGPRQMVATRDQAANGDRSGDAILRNIEKKQSLLTKKKEAALAKLSQAEDTLAKLESKKQEYLEGLQLADTPPGGSFSETAARSAVKAFCWRLIAGSVTFATSLRFSGSYKVALEIVASDFFSKALTMFIGERLMNKSQAGRKTGSDAVGRSLAKALLWRAFAICNTLTMAVFISKDLSIASKIAGSDAIFKTALMFFYERVWASIEWGKDYLVEFSI